MKLQVSIRQMTTIAAHELHFIVPASGRFVQTLHDFEVQGMRVRGTQKSPTPETVPPSSPLMVKLAPIILEFILQTTLIPHPEMSRQDAIDRLHELNRLRLCMVIDRSWENGYADYLHGDNLVADPMEWKTLAFGGNVYKRIYGSTMEAIDPLEIKIVGTRADGSPKLSPDPAELYDNQFWLFQWTTQISKPALADGRYPVARFPQFGPGGVLVPFFYPGGRCSLPAERYKTISNGVAYRPYVP